MACSQGFIVTLLLDLSGFGSSHRTEAEFSNRSAVCLPTAKKAEH